MTASHPASTALPAPGDEHRFDKWIALQSAVGGMLLSLVGMLLAASGHLHPVAGAIAQEVIDLLAVLNALRAARSSGSLTDFRA